MDLVADRIFVSWTQHWDIERYVDNYVRTRRLRPESRASILTQIETYAGTAPFTKADLDFYLDANVLRRS